MRVTALCASVLIVYCASAGAAQQTTSTSSGQAFPARPVRLIVSNAPGSAPDVVARLVSAKLTEAWGQQIVIDNRPGATGLIAAETLARAAPDGYTLWLNTMTVLISTLQAQRHMLAKEFTPISLVASTPFVIVVNASLPVKSIAEWIAYAKGRPGQLSYGSAGQWGSSHLCMEALGAMGGISVVHVPYKSSTQALTDIVAGRIHAYCPAAPGLPLFAGKVRSIGVTYQKPTPLVPGVPPVADTLPGFELLGWYGLQAPLHTPRHLIERINLELVKALKNPELQERLFAVGAEVVGSTAAEHGKFLQKETERWDKVLRDGGGTLPASRG